MSTQMDVLIRVNVELSESTKSFLTSLVEQIAQPKLAKTKKATTQAKAASAVIPETPEVPEVPKAPEASEASQEPISNEETGPKKVTAQDLRTLLLAKIENHREAIKAKLYEFNSPSLTMLDESKYLEMYNFLNSL